MADLDGQLRDYAFTLNGNAYEIDEVFKARDIPQYLTAETLSSTSWTERSQSADTVSTRVINQEAEQKPRGTGQDRFLLVGLLPLEFTEAKLKTYSTGGIVGLEVPPIVFAPKENNLAYRVVTPLTTTFQATPNYYVLTEIDHKTSLWYPKNISQDLVFFFPEYRSNAPIIGLRRKEWWRKVSDASVIESTTRESNFQHATYHGSEAERQVARLHLEVTKFTLSHDPSSLDTIKELIEKNKASKLELKSLIQLFLTTDSDFNKEHASGLSLEIKRKWHQLATVVTADRLMSIREAMNRRNIQVEFRYIRVFLTYGCTKLAQGETDVDKIASDALEFSKTLAGGQDFDFGIPEAQRALLADIFVTLLTKMEPLRESMIKGMEALEARHGGVILKLTRAEIYTRLMNAREEDTMRLLIDQLVAHMGMDVQDLLGQHAAVVQTIVDHTRELIAALAMNN